MEDYITEKFIKKNCILCTDNNYKKYIRSLLFPREFNHSFADGCITSLLKIRGVYMQDMGTNDKGAMAFSIAINIISNTAASGNIIVQEGNFNLDATATGTVSRATTLFNSLLFDFYFDTATRYRVISGSLETSYSYGNQVSDVLAGSLLVTIKPIIYGFTYDSFAINLFDTNNLPGNIANQANFEYSSDNLKIIYIPKTLPPNFIPYSTTTTNLVNIQKTFLNIVFALPKLQTQADWIRINHIISQNVEIIKSLEPFFPQQNLTWEFNVLEKYIKDYIEDKKLIVAEQTKFKLKKIKIEECKCCKEDINDFCKNFNYIKGLPLIENAGDTFIVSRNVTFEILTNNAGNLFIAINPYVLWSLNTYARLAGYNCYPFQFANASTLDFLSSVSTVILTKNSNLANSANTSFINPNYIKDARLLKGYLTIKTKDVEWKNQQMGNYFAGFLPIYQNYTINQWTGVNEYNSTANLTRYSEIKNLLFFTETKAAEGMNIFIPPDVMQNFSLKQIYADPTTDPNGFNTTWLIFGCRDLTKSNLASTQKIEFTFIYECTLKPDQASAAFSLTPNYIQERYSNDEINQILQNYINLKGSFITPLYYGINSPNNYKNIKQEFNIENKINKIKQFYNKFN